MEGGEEGGELEGWGGALEGATRKVHAAAAGAATGEPGSGGGRRGQIGLLRLLRCDCFERTKANPIAHTPRVRDTSPHDRHTIVHRSHARQTVRTCDTPAGSLYYTTTLISLFSLPPLSARLYFPLGSARHTNSKLSLALAKTQHTRARTHCPPEHGAAKHTHTTIIEKATPLRHGHTHARKRARERAHYHTRPSLSLLPSHSSFISQATSRWLFAPFR